MKCATDGSHCHCGLPLARWAACAANKNGLHRTNEDKRKAVLAALAHPKGRGMSDRAIAQHCGVGHVMVNRIRGELFQKNTSGKPQTRTGRDGKTGFRWPRMTPENPPSRMIVQDDETR